MAIKPVLDIESQNIKESWYLHDGVIFWKRNANGGKKAGDPVGFSCRKSGHRNVFLTINGKFKGFVYSRVVWFLHYGEWPTEEVDHIDCNPQNDNIENLRLANRSQNCQNTRFGKKGKLFKGTYKDTRSNKWYCQVQAFGKVYSKCGFDTQEEAYVFRQKIAAEVHGNFAR
jgi:hypothetical protein